jgi:hypothetical protein
MANGGHPHSKGTKKPGKAVKSAEAAKKKDKPTRTKPKG